MAAAGLAQRSGGGNGPGPLSLEDARCPVCADILMEPVTMPCGHSVCLQCFQRTVKLISLCCPLCRTRVSSWARKQSREKSLVNAELWELVRRSHPESCRRRMEQLADGEVFRAPVPLHKSGEARPELEKQKMKGGCSDDTEDRKKKVHRKDECALLRHCQHPFRGVSDSENEEPVGKRTRHVSAFVRKTRGSPAFTKGCLHSSAVQRSRSCTDSEDGRGKGRGHTHHAIPDKASVSHSYNAGILLSSENSRSFSAPVLSLDKRRGIHTSSTSLVIQTKQERSISPESNDSISEELNHFKPIVCSPCTPPKRMPDGRLLEPKIVKSTPRNLTRALHKSTSYEASPTILQKWKQIEVDRQCVKVTSKGTVTSPIAEDVVLKLNPVDEQDRRHSKNGSRDHQRSAEGSKNQKVKPLISNKRRLIFDPCNKEEAVQPVSTSVKSTETVADVSSPKRSSRCDAPSELCARMLEKHAGCGSRGAVDPKNFLSEPISTRSSVLTRPTSRKGKKRSHKTKHLEEAPKIPRTEICDKLDDRTVQRMNQEREDRELALKLQRHFDKERQKVDRHKSSRGKYELRSWAAKEGLVGHHTRRSGRAAKRTEYFNYGC